MQWQLAFQKAPAEPESSMSLKLDEIERSCSGLFLAEKRSDEDDLPK
jgi:hypothetical protein